MRLWGGMFKPSMYDMRVNVDSVNTLLETLSWDGGGDSSKLSAGPEGGVEISWGLQPDLRVLFSFEARGVSSTGRYVGNGLNAGGAASRDLYLSAYGGEAGVSLLMREFQEKSRLFLTARAGVHVLSGASDSWSEEGSLGEYSWTTRLSGTAPGAMIGLEWEMFFTPLGGDSMAPGMFILAGYRFLSFERVEYRSRDSLGVKDSGSLRDGDGDRIAVDMGGPEFRLGLQLEIPAIF